jgi:hypothetical protein
VRIARQLAERTLDQDPQLNAARFAAVRASLLEIDLSQAMMQ